MSVSQPNLNTSPALNLMEAMPINSGSMCEELSNCSSMKKVLQSPATHTLCKIPIFDKSTQTFNHTIKLRINDENQTSPFLITQLKEL